MIDSTARKKLSSKALLGLCLSLLAGLILAGCEEVDEANVDDLMQRAIEHRDAGDLRAASIDLKTLLQKEPDHAGGRLMLGQLYLDFGDAASAEKELRTAQELGAKLLETRYLIARAWLLRGAFSKLLKEYDVAEEMKAGSRSKVLLLRGKAYLALRRLDEAEASFQDAIAAYKKDINEERPHLKLTEPPDYMEAVVGITNVSIQRKEWEKAQSRLSRAIALAPDHPEVLSAKGELAFNRQKYAESETAFQAAFEKRSYDLLLQVGVARAQIMQSKLNEAIANLDDVLKFFPDHILTKYYRSLAALQSKDFQRAKNFADSITKDRPGYVPAHLVSGVASYGLRNYEQANLSLQRYLAAFPNNPRVRRLLGMTRLRLAKPSQALEILQPLAKELPEDSNLLSLVATAAASSGDLTMAGEYFQKAINLEPENQDSRLRLASVKYAAGKHDEAIQELENSVENSPQLLKSRYALLNLHLRNKTFDKALAVARKLVELDPKSPNPFIGEGLALSGMEKWQDALQSFRKALEISPNHLGAAYGEADIYLRTENLAKARELYDRILEQRPGHFRTLMRYIALMRLEKNHDGAERLIVEALKTNPTAVLPRLLSAQIRIDQGQPIKAISILNDVLNANPNNPELLQVLGRAQIAAGKAGQAVITLERLVTLRKDSAPAHFLLSQAYALLGNRQGMIEELNKTLAIAPEFFPAELFKVRAMVREKKFAEATQQISVLKQKFPENSAIDKLEAWAMLQDKRPQEAAAILEKIRKKENTEAIAIQLAAARWAAEDREKAVAELETWTKDNPGQNRAKLELANYYLLLNDRTKARDIYEKLAAVYTENWIVLSNFADLLKTEDLDKALIYAERAFKLAPRVPPVVLTLSNVLLKKNSDVDRVIKLTRSLAKRYPDNATTHVTLATALDKKGKRDEAIQLLTEFIARSQDENSKIEAGNLLRDLQK